MTANGLLKIQFLTLNQGVSALKIFSVAFNSVPKKDSVFVTVSHFHPGLIFSDKA
jgi:hypothetical protein